VLAARRGGFASGKPYGRNPPIRNSEVRRRPLRRRPFGRAAADRDGKADVPLAVEIVDAAGETVAWVEKLLQVRRSDLVEPRPPGAPAPGACRADRR